MQVAGPLAAIIEGTQGPWPPSALLRATGNVNAGRTIMHGHYGQTASVGAAHRGRRLRPA